MDQERLTGIKVLFQRPGRASDGKQLLTTAILDGSTSIHEIKLTGRTKGWFKAGDRLVSLAISRTYSCHIVAKVEHFGYWITLLLP